MEGEKDIPTCKKRDVVLSVILPHVIKHVSSWARTVKPKRVMPFNGHMCSSQKGGGA